MKTIKDEYINELHVNKSRFIAIIRHINSDSEVKEIINYYKTIYKDANHYCYAYVTGSKKKASDDKEPAKTAGIPILNVIEKENLTDVLVIVIRYFGGILLGSGGLTRAYTKATSNLIQSITTYNLTEGINIIITFPYDLTNVIDYLLKDSIILNKEFTSLVTYNINILLDNYHDIKNDLIKYTDTLYEKEKVFILK